MSSTTVLATDGLQNLTSVFKKRDILVKAYGDGGFDYAGNSRHDLQVSSTRHATPLSLRLTDMPSRWQVAHGSELLAATKPTLRTIPQDAARAPVAEEFADRRAGGARLTSTSIAALVLAIA